MNRNEHYWSRVSRYRKQPIRVKNLPCFPVDYSNRCYSACTSINAECVTKITTSYAATDTTVDTYKIMQFLTHNAIVIYGIGRFKEYDFS